jgi:hypothetical protein
LEPDPIAVAGGFNGTLSPDWYGYAEGNPQTNTDPSGLSIWKVAYRIGQHALRYGRTLTRGEALARSLRGMDVVTNGTRVAKKAGKDVSRALGGPGKCVVEAGPSGGRHVHAARNASGSQRYPGHIFIDPNLALPWYLAVIDDNDDGTIDYSDVFELLNPLPTAVTRTEDDWD